MISSYRLTQQIAATTWGVDQDGTTVQTQQKASMQLQIAGLDAGTDLTTHVLTSIPGRDAKWLMLGASGGSNP
jgi:hypothetical protein